MPQRPFVVVAPDASPTCATPRETGRTQEKGRREKQKSKLTFPVTSKDRRQLHAVLLKPLGEARANTGGPKPSDNLAGTINSGAFELENFLHHDCVAFHAGNFRD